MTKQLFTLMLGLISHTAFAEIYYNERFDFSLDVPESLIWQAEAFNGDGRAFELANSTAEIVVFGNLTPMIDDMTAAEFLDTTQNNYKKKYTITYERKKQNSYTVSGFDDKQRIFYHVIKVDNGISAQLHFDYPLAEKHAMDAIVTQMARSFALHQ